MELARVVAVLFDMDGTLVDSDAAVARAWRTWTDEYAVEPLAWVSIANGRLAADTVRRLQPDLGVEAVAVAAARQLSLQHQDLSDAAAAPGAVSAGAAPGAAIATAPKGLVETPAAPARAPRRHRHVRALPPLLRAAFRDRRRALARRVCRGAVLSARAPPAPSAAPGPPCRWSSAARRPRAR